MTFLAADPEKLRYSFEQYILLLQNNEQRLEYDHGDIYAMAGNSANHAAISANMWRALDDALGADTTFRAYMVDRVVRLPPEVTVMPDVVVTCDSADQGEAFFLDSPLLVVEVLSKSTEARDRTYKLLRYQAKQSIQEIGHEEYFPLTSLNITISVSEIYRRLSIPFEKRTYMPLEMIEPVEEQEDA